MRTIIASTDFSASSLNAVNYAADMAAAIHAELIVLNVFNIPVAYHDGPVIVMPVERLREASEIDLDNVRSAILERTAGKIIVHTKCRMGNITEELADICSTVKPFAVVIGTRGKTHLQKAIYGSNALSIIKHLSWPVICVPPGKEFGKKLSRICLACDFRDVIETVPAGAIHQFVKLFKAELHILNIDNKVCHSRVGPPEESFSLHQMFLQEKPQYHYAENDDIEDGINEFVQTNNMDLLITIPKKHGLFRKLFKGTHTSQLIKESPVPLLCIHE
jgi:nucleotide-binding universal stress UspA family protein